MKIFAALLLLSTAALSHAQTPAKTPVKFSCTCEDAVGAKYATALRDLIAASSRYQSASDFVVGTGKDAVWNFGIHVVSLDPSAGNTGERTVLAVTITVGPLFMTSLVQTCGDAEVQSCASTTFAQLDKVASN
ncbi:MAG TPA: hypothetical protein VIY29_11070 [Ktedonobacteraceae bacterium]